MVAGVPTVRVAAKWVEEHLPVLLGVGLPALVYLLIGNAHLNLADEGYLWYGVQRAAAGEVPLQDFQAYDPGRYYWCAAWSLLLGDGILGVRQAATIFQALGLTCGLLVAKRVVRSPWLLPVAGAVLVLWMFPRYKVFESSISMMAVYACVRLFERPTVRMHFAAGVFVGLAGVMGRNHAFYTFVAFVALILFLQVKRRDGQLLQRLGAWGGGVVAGYSPVLFLFAFLPGFREGYVDFIRWIISYGSQTPLPYPWPWTLSYFDGPWYAGVANASKALAFLTPVLVYPLGLVLALTAKTDELSQRAVVICCAFVGMLYSHHSAVRSDTAHLAQCVHPALLGAIALLGSPQFRRRAAYLVAWAVLALTAWVFAVAFSPDMRHVLLGQPDKEVRGVDVAGETVRMFPDVGGYIERMEATIRQHVQDDEPLFIAPSRPSFYPLLERSSPTWMIYFFLPASGEDVQREMIARFEELGLRWAFIADVPIAGREELLFRNSYPLVWEHFMTNYERVPTPGLLNVDMLLRRRD